MSTFDQRKSLDGALPFATTAEGLLRQTVNTLGGEFEVQAFVLGSVRRWNGDMDVEPTIGDIDVVVTCREGEEYVQSFEDVEVPGFMTATPKKAHGWLQAYECKTVDGDPMPVGRMMIDAWWCPWSSIGPFGFFLTGPPELNIVMRQVSQEAGLMLTQYGLFRPVPAPTKTYPDRVKPGARVDVPDQQDKSVVGAESRFWSQWCEAVGLGAPFPWPWERKEVTRWLQGRSRATRSVGTTPG